MRDKDIAIGAHSYPTAADLAAMGARLECDVCLWNMRLHREYYSVDCAAPNIPLDELPRRKHVKTAAHPRVYKSNFVGVTEHRGRWIAQYGPRGKTKTRVYPLTPEGERQAACDRARALGMDAPELRS